MWQVFNEDGDLICRKDDLYEAQVLADAIGGRIELKEDER